MTPTTVSTRDSAFTTANTIALLAGIWLFVSPWVYGASAMASSWNSWIFGVIIVILAAIRLGRPMGTAGISWAHSLIGVWVFISPWVYGYAMDTGRFINSLCVGVVLFVAAISISSTTPHTHHPVPTHN